MGTETKKDVRYGFYDGMFANSFATLTGGVFLTGFALSLGMNEFMIGLLASMPFLVTVFQFPTSVYIRRSGRRKKIAYHGALAARVTWIFVLIVALFPGISFSIKVLGVLGLIFVSYAFASISYVSWLSWISDLVPQDRLGRFFGTRNMLSGAAGMVVMVVFGKSMDQLGSQNYGSLPLGFTITFLSAVLFGIVSLHFVKRISETTLGDRTEGLASLRVLAGLPFKGQNFRRLLIFSFFWSFSVYFASPFFTLYFLRDLKYSYGFVATLGFLSALADLLGMQLWGRFSDRVRNKAVIQLTSWVAIFLPLAWVMVRPQSVALPVILHLLGGGFWAGINLCTNNLLLRISPQQNRPFFLSAFNTVAGLGAATGPIIAGLTLNAIAELEFHVFTWELFPIQIIFIMSTLFRILSFQIFRKVHEPEEVPALQIVRILRSLRGLNIASGFNGLLHPFVELEKEEKSGV